MKHIASLFGQSLDNDQYDITLTLLSIDCKYDMGSEMITGAKNIIDSYEQNMIAGRKKMDRLEWGQSTIDEISSNEFIVNFTDKLYHKSEQYTFRCQQRLFINKEGKIYQIEHITDKAAWQKLQEWYKSVGIPTS